MAYLPRVSDGQLLFLQNLLAKAEDDARIAIILNGSPLFSGDAESGLQADLTFFSADGKLITFVFDSLFVWVLQIPLAAVLSRLTSLPILPMFLLVEAMNLIKCTMGVLMLRSRKWVVNLVK